MNIRLHRTRVSHLTPVPAPLGGLQIEDPDVVPAIEPLRPAPLGATAEPALTTPFEDWCERTGVHPEALGAWETFSFHRAEGA